MRETQEYNRPTSRSIAKYLFEPKLLATQAILI